MNDMIGAAGLVHGWVMLFHMYFVWLPSRLPSFSDSAESIGEYRKLGEHGSELLDQWQQSQLRHGWDQFVEHAALAEQRMGALLGGV
jgi:hypothetical protein